MQECGTGSDDHTDEVVDSMWRDHLDFVPKNPCCNRCGRFGPTADRFFSTSIRRVAVPLVHAGLIVDGPGDLGELIEQTALNGEVSLKSRVVMIAIDDVNVAIRQ